MMECVLVSRDDQGITLDRSLRLDFPSSERERGVARVKSSLPAAQWSDSAAGTSETVTTHAERAPASKSLERSHALSDVSRAGSGEPNELATYTQGRERFLSDHELRDACEDDLRAFSELSDYVDGFMLSTPISDGLSGLSASFVEALRDEFPKASLFATVSMQDERAWRRATSERAQAQRTLNEALALVQIEEFASLVLPLQPAPRRRWRQDKDVWTRYLKPERDQGETYSQLLTLHQQSMNSELRAADGLAQISEQLNWRGGTKFAHLHGASPLAPPQFYRDHAGAPLVQRWEDGLRDFSALPAPEEMQEEDTPAESKSGHHSRPRPRLEGSSKPFADYAVIRGLDEEEFEQFGHVLERISDLREPLSTWSYYRQPFPLSHLPPLFHSLDYNGRPVVKTAAPTLQPGILHSVDRAAFFSAAPPTPAATVAKEELMPSDVEPAFVPIYTALTTTPKTALTLSHYVDELRTLARSAVLVSEYEQGEYGLGRDGIVEVRERLESLRDGYAEVVMDDGDEAEDEDEHWDM